jgi:hypothetical protein
MQIECSASEVLKNSFLRDESAHRPDGRTDGQTNELRVSTQTVTAAVAAAVAKKEIRTTAKGRITQECFKRYSIQNMLNIARPVAQTQLLHARAGELSLKKKKRKNTKRVKILPKGLNARGEAFSRFRPAARPPACLPARPIARSLVQPLARPPARPTISSSLEGYRKIEEQTEATRCVELISLSKLRRRTTDCLYA